MTHAIHRVDQFSIVGSYTFSVRFNDGTTRHSAPVSAIAPGWSSARVR